MRRTRAKPAAFPEEGDELVVAAVAVAQPQEAVSQDAALQKRVELVPDEGRQVRTCGGFDVRTEGLGVLLDQSVQRGLLRAAALVADRGTFG
jgi:hypothetical protein